MSNIMTFEPGKSYQFYRCKCGFTTKNKRIHFEDFEQESDADMLLRQKKRWKREKQSTKDQSANGYHHDCVIL